MADPYVDPKTGVLYNLLGLTDAASLSVAEREATAIRNAELKTSHVVGVFDLDHLKEFHRRLFQDIFAWAGKIRTVPIAKGSTLFCLPEHIESSAASIFRPFAQTPTLSRDPTVAAQELAVFLGELNALHPFREGNGRAQRSFVWQFAFEHGWMVDWGSLDEQANIDASAHAMAGRYAPLAGLLQPLLEPVLP